LYEKIKQKIQIDALEGEDSWKESSDEEGGEIIRSYKDDGVRGKKRRRKREISGEYLEKGFGGVSYQDDYMNYGRDDENSTRNVNRKAYKVDGSTSVSGKVRKAKREKIVTPHRKQKRGKKRDHRSRRLKLDKTLANQEPIIRQSLQSEGYYRRHRQKARNVPSLPSDSSFSKTPKSGSVVPRKSKKNRKSGIPPFQHIPISFMNTATPKPRKDKGNESTHFSEDKRGEMRKSRLSHQSRGKRSRHKESKASDYRREKKDDKGMKKKSSLLDLDNVLVYGTLRSTMQNSQRCEESNAQDIMKSYGYAQYSKHNYSKDRFEESCSKKEKSRNGKSSKKRKPKYSLNSLSNLMTMPNAKTHKERGSSFHNKASSKRKGINLNLNIMPSHPTTQTYNNPPIQHKNDSRHQRNSSSNLQAKEKQREKRLEKEFLQLSPTMTSGGKISASYGGYYPMKSSKITRKEREHSQNGHIDRVDEMEEYSKKRSKDLERYKKGMKLRSNQKSRGVSKGERRAKRSLEVDYDLKLDVHSNHHKKRSKQSKSGLTLDMDSLANPQTTNTHIESHSGLPPYSPMQYPGTTKNSRIPKHSRTADDHNALSLLSMNNKRSFHKNGSKSRKLYQKIQAHTEVRVVREYDHRLSRDKSRHSHHQSNGRSKKKAQRSHKIQYGDYDQITHSFVETTKDGTRNYTIAEYHEYEDDERRVRRKKKHSSKKLRDKGGSYGGHGDLGSSYRDRGIENVRDNRIRDKNYHEKYRKMKLKMMKEGKYGNSQSFGGSGKENLLNFGGAQWK
jgi:hypothetical protein